MSIYKPTLLDKFKDFVNGLKSNWDAYEGHVEDFETAKGIITDTVEDFETAKGIITDTFDETRTYAVGDYAIYENVLYKCVEAIEEAGEWDADKWAATNIAEEFKSHQAESASKHIAESAYNSDGYYIKFDDGTLICTGVREFTDVACTTALGTLFYAGSNNFPMGKYPHPFDTTNVPIVLNLSSYNNNSLTAWVTTSTFSAFDGVNINAHINYIRHTSTTFSKVWIFFTATGRWKP